MTTLNEIIAIYHEIEEMLVESGGELTPEVEATLDANQESLENKLDNYADFIIHLKGVAEGLKAWESQIVSRRKAIENSVKRLREHALYGLLSIGTNKIKTDRHSFSVIRRKSWNIGELNHETMDDMVKSGYAEWVFKPSITALKEAYGDNPPEFVEVVESESLNIR